MFPHVHLLKFLQEVLTRLNCKQTYELNVNLLMSLDCAKVIAEVADGLLLEVETDDYVVRFEPFLEDCPLCDKCDLTLRVKETGDLFLFDRWFFANKSDCTKIDNHPYNFQPEYLKEV